MLSLGCDLEPTGLFGLVVDGWGLVVALSAVYTLLSLFMLAIAGNERTHDMLLRARNLGFLLLVLSCLLYAGLGGAVCLSAGRVTVLGYFTRVIGGAAAMIGCVIGVLILVCVLYVVFSWIEPKLSYLFSSRGDRE